MGIVLAERRGGVGMLGALGAAAVLVLSAGCTSPSSARAGETVARSSSAVAVTRSEQPGTRVPTATRTTTGTSTVPAKASTVQRILTTTVTRTKPGRTITIGPPQPTPTPAAVSGDCPYLSADVVSDITGQHHGPTQLIDDQPQPMCLFYRADGGPMGSVRVIKAASPQQAVAAVDQHVPVADSEPASQPVGWSGGSMTTPGQMTQDSSARSVYAVSKGDIAVVAEENESPSIKARVMAVCAIYGLKLQSGAAPDYCSGAQG